jgi:hypothetical protein
VIGKKYFTSDGFAVDEDFETAGDPDILDHIWPSLPTWHPRLSLQCATHQPPSAGLPPGCAYLLFLSMVIRYHKGSLLAQPPIAGVDAAAAQHRFAFSQDWSSAIAFCTNEQRRGSRAVDAIIAGEVLR